jgi:predicted DCC family thiol-disulfide oxidoreductase YuxK
MTRERWTSTAPLLLYDGTCGFCARSVQFVLAHERTAHALQFARLEGPFARELFVRHPELPLVDTIIWYEPATNGDPERVLVRSDVTLELLCYLGGPWRVLSQIGRLVPRPLRDAVYDFVARHRHTIAGRNVCVVPTSEQRARFIDLERT